MSVVLFSFTFDYFYCLCIPLLNFFEFIFASYFLYASYIILPLFLSLPPTPFFPFLLPLPFISFTLSLHRLSFSLFSLLLFFIFIYLPRSPSILIFSQFLFFFFSADPAATSTLFSTLFSNFQKMEDDSTQRLIVLSLSSLLSVPTHALPPDALSNIQNIFQQTIRELVFIEEEKTRQDNREERDGGDDDDDEDDDGNYYTHTHTHTHTHTSSFSLLPLLLIIFISPLFLCSVTSTTVSIIPFVTHTLSVNLLSPVSSHFSSSHLFSSLYYSS